jgi:hypothetical protein
MFCQSLPVESQIALFALSLLHAQNEVAAPCQDVTLALYYLESISLFA